MKGDCLFLQTYAADPGWSSQNIVVFGSRGYYPADCSEKATVKNVSHCVTRPLHHQWCLLSASLFDLVQYFFTSCTGFDGSGHPLKNRDTL